MSNHTPGPWSYSKCPCGMKGCASFTISVQGSVGFEEGDASLIAAAPDLLDALKRIKATGVFVGAIAQEMMDAAIEKAEGA